MFGRRNPDRPLDLSPEPPEPDLNLDLLDDLPDLLGTEEPAPATPEPPAAPPQPAAPEPPAEPPAQADPTTTTAYPWQASTSSILGPSVTRMLHAQPEEPRQPPAAEAVPRTDLSSPPPRGPLAPSYQPAPQTTPLTAPPAQPAPAAPPAAPPQPASEPARARAIAESVIGPDDFFDGRYRSERGVRIQGNARGSIESRQYIFVEAGAQVEADLSAEDITISGDFSGKIVCRRRLEVTGTGKINGQVQTMLLVVQEGGALDGELHMRGSQEQAPSQS